MMQWPLWLKKLAAPHQCKLSTIANQCSCLEPRFC